MAELPSNLNWKLEVSGLEGGGAAPSVPGVGKRKREFDPQELAKYLPKGFQPLTTVQKEQLSYMKEARRQREEARQFEEMGKSPSSKSIGSLTKMAARFLPFLGAAGITGALFTLVRNSRIAQTTFSAVSSILGAMVDLALLPLVPLITKGLENFAKLVPFVQQLTQAPAETISKAGKEAARDIGTPEGGPLKEAWSVVKVFAGSIADAAISTKDLRERQMDLAKEGPSKEYYSNMVKIAREYAKAPIESMQTIFDALLAERMMRPPTWGERTEDKIKGLFFGDNSKKYENQDLSLQRKNDVNITVHVNSQPGLNPEEVYIKAREGVYTSLNAVYGFGNYGTGRN